MKILFLTYYFEPDLCAGSFRNSSLIQELIKELNHSDQLDVITTYPHRYDSYKIQVNDIEYRENNVKINRIKIPNHKNGLLGQIRAFKVFYTKALDIVQKEEYDLIYASSSRLFTAFLGAKIAKRNKAKLYLDIRDIFREGIKDIFKNPIIKAGLDICIRPIEYYTFRKATHINLISKGFESYFFKYTNCSLSFYSNGIDSIFLDKKEEFPVLNKNKRTIIYAGNIGEGQGLDRIIPKIAKMMENEFSFIIYGDGGAKQKLLNAISELNISNIEIHNPINRSLLIEEYSKADFLFLHLNNHKAFERVLPSKLFEYGAFNKPIIAGVAGYAADFIKENLPNTILFDPCDYNDLYNKLINYNYMKVVRSDFEENFSRKKINKKMAKSIIYLVR